MIINGTFQQSNSNTVTEFTDENGVCRLKAVWNRINSSQAIITNPKDSISIIGLLKHEQDMDEFKLFNDIRTILKITQKTGLNLPKFSINSCIGEYKTEFSLIKRELIIYEAEKAVLTFKVKPPNYTINVNDNDSTFELLCVIYGIITLLQQRSLFKLLI